jgi:hypothetical protein
LFFLTLRRKIVHAMVPIWRPRMKMANHCVLRQCLANREQTVDPEQIESARRKIATVRLDFVRNRAMQGLHRTPITAARCAAVVRDSAALVGHRGARDCVSSMSPPSKRTKLTLEKKKRTTLKNFLKFHVGPLALV